MTAVTEMEGIRSLTPDDCQIKPGYAFSRNFFHVFNVPVVAEVGGYARVGGGYVVPVKYKDGWFRRGRCALLRYCSGEGVFSIDSVIEHVSKNSNVQLLLRDSTKVPQVLAGGDRDPGTLYLVVTDTDECEGETVEVRYELALNGILGNENHPDTAKHLWSG